MARSASSKTRRGTLPTLGIVLASLALAALAWIGAGLAARTQRWEELRQVEAEASNMALGYAGELHRELLSLRQVLNILQLEWQRDPGHFNLTEWEALLLEDPSAVAWSAMLDARGVVVASTEPGLVGTGLGDSAYFRAERATNSGRSWIGPPVHEPTGRWVIDIARRLDDADRRFAGVIVIAYRLDVLAQQLGAGNLGRGDEALVVGSDGKIRALLAPTPREPGGTIAGTALMAQVAAHASSWTGPSPEDGRIHSFALRQVPGTDLTVLVGVDDEAALAGSGMWRLAAYGFAALMTVMLIVIGGGLLAALRAAQGREAGLAAERAVLARANAELEAARARADAKSAQLEGTLAGMSDGISLLDRDLRLMAWNDRFPECSGVPPEMLRVGLPMEEILRAQARAGEFGPMADEAAVAREVAARIAALRAGSRVGVIERSRPDGRVLELRRTALPGGGFVTLYADITARKEVEAAHRRARELAEAAAAEKSRFVAIVSHEIRTPLNVTLNALGLLGRSALDADQRRLTDLALQAGEGLRGLLTDILDLSRMEVGQLAMRPGPCALAPLLEGLVALFQGPAAARGVTLEARIGPGVPEQILIDGARLRQVLMNFLSNAARYAEPGPTTLSAETGIADGRTVLRLAVSDPGPPITAAQRERLFRPFSQLEQSEAGGGAGLGLAICQALATLLGGQIGCDPTHGRGKAFWLSLPLAEGAAAPSAHARPEAPARRRVRARVLVAEDVRAGQEVIAAMLRREGHAVELADDGAAAIRLAATRPFDIVLMDVHMPGTNGLEATRRIRALGGPASRVPVLALTANVSREDRQQCLQAGMNDLLAKPIEPAAFMAAIQRHVGGFPGPAPTPGPALPAPVPAEAGPELDLPRIRRLCDELPPGVFGALVADCLDDLRARLPALAAALAARDCTAATASAHAMAGVAESYGMRSLGARLRRIMDAARSGQAEAAAAAGEGVETHLAAAEQALRAALTPETA